MNLIDNFIKGPLTSIVGLILMCFGFWGWWREDWTEWEAGSIALIGFSLLWMRDKIPGWIERFVGAILEKFTNKKP